MITANANQTEINALAKALEGTSKGLDNELKIAINATAKKTRTMMSREIRKELAAKAATVNKTIRVATKATKSRLLAVVRLKETARISLKEFGGRQTRRGVSYKTSKRSGRKTVSGGFQGPRPGVMAARLRGHVFKRLGQSRLPIKKLYGPSPWGVFKGQRLESPVRIDTDAELRKQIDRRIRFNLLKKHQLI